MNRFSQNLANLLSEHKMSQEKLAVALSVSQQTISRYVKGLREPDLNTVIAIANFFSVTIDYLLGREDWTA